MRVLEALEPKKVFSFFEDICRIPHPSMHTKAISDYVASFARSRGLEYVQDEINNVTIFLPASEGYEDVPAVILQGHLDMVAEKEPSCTLDMKKEGLDLCLDGDRIFARGTTLGGDDGIAVAMMLALLDSPELPHPRIEALFTIDEETGMAGAIGLDVSRLQGRRMVNLDSEEEGVFTVACAGGVDAKLLIPMERENCRCACAKLRIEGLTGGHSGVEIGNNRTNAGKLLGRALDALKNAVDYRIVTVFGGFKKNAIMSAAEAVVALDGDFKTAERAARDFAEILKAETAKTDPTLCLTFTQQTGVTECCTRASTRRIIDLLLLVPFGVAAMSADIPGLVQTSSNLGILRIEDGTLRADVSVRSSVSTQKRMMTAQLDALARALGGKTVVRDNYPAWEYQPESPLREQMVKIYREQYGEEPQVVAIHAGLECGLFSEKLPGLDCVSIGPNMTAIHTPKESLSVASVARVWKYLLALLESFR